MYKNSVIALCLEGSHKKTSVCKKELEFQCSEGEDENSSVFKNTPEFQCLQKKTDNNFIVFKNRAKITMFGRKRS